MIFDIDYMLASKSTLTTRIDWPVAQMSLMTLCSRRRQCIFAICNPLELRFRGKSHVYGKVQRTISVFEIDGDSNLVHSP